MYVNRTQLPRVARLAALLALAPATAWAIDTSQLPPPPEVPGITFDEPSAPCDFPPPPKGMTCVPAENKDLPVRFCFPDEAEGGEQPSPPVTK